MRFFSSTGVNPHNLPAEVRIRPVLSQTDVDALRRVASIRHAGLWVQVNQRMEYQAAHSQGLMIYGADNSYLDVQGGTLLSGRWFSTAEMASGQPVVVVEAEVANHLFGREEPLGRVVRIGGKAFTVIGVFAKPDNVFQPPGASDGAVVPFRAAKESFPYDETNSLFIAVSAARGVSVDVAKDAATAALRRSRGLRPAAPNSFDILTQDQILETIDKLTSAFFLVMIALSSVGLWLAASA